MKYQLPDIDKIYLYAKDPFESEYLFLINGRKKVGINELKNPKAFIEYLQTIDDVYENLEDYNPTRKRKVLIVLDDMTANMEANKKLSPIVTELFLRGRKLNISFVFVSKSYFKVFRTTRLNAAHYFIMKIPNGRKLRHIAPNNLSDIESKDFMKFYKDYTKKKFSFLVNDTTLSSDNPLRFRKTLL